MADDGVFEALLEGLIAEAAKRGMVDLSLVEARDTDRRFYPLTDRAHLLKEADPEAALETLRQDLLQHERPAPGRRR
jgi:hypothetical protein